MLFPVFIIAAYLIFKRIDSAPISLKDKFFCGVMSFLIAIIADFIISTAIILFTDQYETSTVVISKTDIVALQDTNSSSGNFFLGCGTVDGEMRYAYYYQTEHGIKYASISAESSRHPVYIKYLDNKNDTPYILKYGEKEDQFFTNENIPVWLTINSLIHSSRYENGEVIDSKISSEPGFTDDPNNYRYEIWIPEGSILEEFELDLK